MERDVRLARRSRREKRRTFLGKILRKANLLLALLGLVMLYLLATSLKWLSFGFYFYFFGWWTILFGDWFE
jgi:hypothetical protein